MEELSVLGHLAFRFQAQPENLATEALCYLLRKSSTARSELARLLSGTEAGLDEHLQFQTQVAGEDRSIPDVVGTDADGNQILIIEAKFWASLTDNQPVKYIERLPSARPGVLLFVIPALRFDTLGAEIERRLTAAGWELSESLSARPDLVYSRLWRSTDSPPSHAVAMISWRALLDTLHEAFVLGREVGLAADSDQLQGLCARMDSDAFLPLQSEELTFATPQRIMQYLDLVDELASMINKRKLAEKGKYRAASSRGVYGQYMQVHDFGVYLNVSFRRWSLRMTPFWLVVWDIKDWRPSPVSRERLLRLEIERPSRLFIDEREGLPMVPLFPPLGVEKDKVLEGLLAQFVEVCELLNPSTG